MMHSEIQDVGSNVNVRATDQGRAGTAIRSAWAALAIFGVSAAAGATSFTFSFNPLANGASSTTIQTYMTAVAGSNVTVTGAIASNSYTAEGRVVGPSLGTSDGATGPTDNTHNHPGALDTFIMNNQGAGSNSFTLDFGTFSIFSIAFDWEIFPDITCSPTCSGSGPNWPDIELLVDGKLMWTKLGVGTTNPQNIGIASLNLDGAHTLTFVDWPPEVGIDNLVVNGCPPTAPRCLQKDLPEPSSLPLAGLALAAVLVTRRMGSRKSRAA